MILGEESGKAVKRLSDQGFPVWEQQKSQVVLPRDISSVSSETLSDLFTRLTAWINYAGQQLAAAQVDEAVLERKRDVAYAKLMSVKGGQRGDKVTVLKAQANSDPYISELDEKLTEAFAYRKMLEAVYSNYEREITLVSREITRRTQDQRARREDRFTA